MSLKLAFFNAGTTLRSRADAIATLIASWRPIPFPYARDCALPQHLANYPPNLCMALESTQNYTSDLSHFFICKRPPTLTQHLFNPLFPSPASPTLGNRSIFTGAKLANKVPQVLIQVPSDGRLFTASATMGASEDTSPAPSSGVNEAVAKLREFIGTNEKTDPGGNASDVLNQFILHFFFYTWSMPPYVRQSWALRHSHCFGGMNVLIKCQQLHTLWKGKCLQHCMMESADSSSIVKRRAAR